MKKRYIITMAIIAGIIMGIAVYIITTSGKESPIDNVFGTNSGLISDVEPEYAWKQELDSEIISIFNDLYPEDYEFDYDSNKEWKITLKELKDIHDVDLSNFNSEEIECNLDNSYIHIDNTYNDALTTFHLECLKK